MSSDSIPSAKSQVSNLKFLFNCILIRKLRYIVLFALLGPDFVNLFCFQILRGGFGISLFYFTNIISVLMLCHRRNTRDIYEMDKKYLIHTAQLKATIPSCYPEPPSRLISIFTQTTINQNVVLRMIKISN